MLIYREAIKKRRCLHLDSSLSFNTYITIEEWNWISSALANFEKIRFSNWTSS